MEIAKFPGKNITGTVSGSDTSKFTHVEIAHCNQYVAFMYADNGVYVNFIPFRKNLNVIKDFLQINL